jgi:hypothetical protein
MVMIRNSGMTFVTGASAKSVTSSPVIANQDIVHIMKVREGREKKGRGWGRGRREGAWEREREGGRGVGIGT